MVIKWVKEKRAHHRQELLLIEEHISLLFSDSLLGYFSNEGKRTLLRLDTVKNNILELSRNHGGLKFVLSGLNRDIVTQNYFRNSLAIIGIKILSGT